MSEKKFKGKRMLIFEKKKPFSFLKSFYSDCMMFYFSLHLSKQSLICVQSELLSRNDTK